MRACRYALAVRPVVRELAPEWVERLRAERWYAATAAGMPDGMAVCFRLGVTGDGRLCVTGLFLGATDRPGDGRSRVLELGSNVEVTSSLLRLVPVARLLEAMVCRAGDTDPHHAYFASLPEQTMNVPAVARRPGRRGHGDEHYRQVADAWRAARASSPRAPMRAFLAANRWAPRTESTIYRWLARARALGLLDADGSPGPLAEPSGGT
jgi:hypothetical protein